MRFQSEDVVYVVEQGEYSDREIVAIFTDEKEFEAFCAVHANEFEQRYDALSANVLPVTHCEAKEGLQSVMFYNFSFTDYPDAPLSLNYITPQKVKNKEGILPENTIHKFEGWIDRKANSPVVMDKSWYSIVVCLRENNREKAIKIAADMLAREKAEEEGLV